MQKQVYGLRVKNTLICIFSQGIEFEIGQEMHVFAGWAKQEKWVWQGAGATNQSILISGEQGCMISLIPCFHLLSCLLNETLKTRLPCPRT